MCVGGGGSPEVHEHLHCFERVKLQVAKSSQVTFIYIALLTIQIVIKHCTVSK